MLFTLKVIENGVCKTPWTIVNMDEVNTLSRVIQLHEQDESLNVSMYSVSVGKSESALIKTDVDAPLNELVPIFGRFILFNRETPVVHLTAEGKELEPEPHLGEKNAFTVMKNAQKSKLGAMPEKLEVKNNKKHALQNKVIDYLTELKIGFNNMENSKCVVKLLTDTMWYIDPHIDTLTERYDRFPPDFKRFLKYNIPESHKHSRMNLQRDKLAAFHSQIELTLEQPFMSKPKLVPLKENLDMLSLLLNGYVDYLDGKLTSSKEQQSRMELTTPSKDIKVLVPQAIRNPTYVKRYSSLNAALNKVSHFEPISLDDLTSSIASSNRGRRYYMDYIPQGISTKSVHLKLTRGSNLRTLNFIWTVPKDLEEGTLIEENSAIIVKLTNEVPKYHSRAMRMDFIKTSSLMLPDVKTGFLRHIYMKLTGDASTGQNPAYDERIRLAFTLGDPNIITDLREHNPGRPPVYEVFFEKVQTYLDTVVETAVDERRQTQVTHMAAAISVSDLLKQVSEICPPDTKIPSEQWLRLQFAPKVPSSLSSLQFTGRFNVRFMVQSRQFRLEHLHSHYASALFMYMKDFAVRFKHLCNMVCQDDKHHCKVGEPAMPVAAVERGRRVVTIDGLRYSVADHDFTKFSVVPSVKMVVEIPDSTEGSFYRGQVYVGTKDCVFEPSSPLRHATELITVLESENITSKPILLLYTDGGPDHRCTYLSVKLSLLCIFIIHDLDMLCAVRTPPYNSWKNPPERVMSILNLGLQAIGLQRKKMEEVYEAAIKSCNSLADLRKKAKDNNDLEQAIRDSVESVKILMSSIFQRLSLKDKPLKVFAACSSEQMDQVWKAIGMPTESMKQADLSKALKEFPAVQKKLDHWSVSRNYLFCLKKCGKSECDMCLPPRTPPDEWTDINVLPDPVPGRL